MTRRRLKLLWLAAALLMIVGISSAWMIYRYSSKASNELGILYRGIPEETLPGLLALLTELFAVQLDSDQSLKLLDLADSSSESTKPLLLYTYWIPDQDGKERRSFHALPETNSTLMPSAFRTAGRQNGKLIALPLAMDHVELAFRRDIFGQKGMLVEDRLTGLESLEAVLKDLAGPNFHPLMVAGAVESDFLDLISVLLLSLGGPERYKRFIEASLYDQAPGQLLTLDMGDGFQLMAVIKRLQVWRRQGLMHPEWLAFQHADVLGFVEASRTAAVVMRLSTHRTWSPNTLRFWQSSSFPPANSREVQGAGIIAPLLTLSVMADHPLAGQTASLLPELLTNHYQNRLGPIWGLAPVNATAETIDREADDLRFWAAAAGQLLPSLSDTLSGSTRVELLDMIRAQLGP